MPKKNQSKTDKPKLKNTKTQPKNPQADGMGIDEMEMRKELEQAQASTKENWDQVLRLKAELENQKRRHSRLLEDAHKYALDNFVKELMTVKDSLDMGIQSAKNQSTSLESMQEGLDMMDKSFMGVLEKFGVNQVNPIDEKFDPSFHEAINMVPMDGKASGVVIEVIQIGMTLNGRLVRPARVIVAK